MKTSIDFFASLMKRDISTFVTMQVYDGDILSCVSLGFATDAPRGSAGSFTHS